MLFRSLLFLLYAVLLGNFGKYSLSEIEFPAVVLMSDVKIKGSFFKRADALMLSVWVFTLFSVLNMSLYYAVLRCENFAENTGKIIFTFNKNRHSRSNKQFGSDRQKSHDKEKSTCFRKCSCYTYVILIVRKFFELQEWFCNLQEIGRAHV